MRFFGLKEISSHPTRRSIFKGNSPRVSTSTRRDYKCRVCGKVYNLFTDTLWQGARYPCRKIVLLMRGVAQGVSTQHLAQELGLDRSHVLKKRHAIQQLAEERLSPLSPV